MAKNNKVKIKYKIKYRGSKTNSGNYVQLILEQFTRFNLSSKINRTLLLR